MNIKDTCCGESVAGVVAGAWGDVCEQLKKLGIELEACCTEPGPDGKVKVVCVAPSLSDSIQQMCKSPRGETVMVRVDAETNAALDAWVETGFVKSRSEAAALFIREGLKVRASELERMKEALNEVRKAKERLKEQARDIFGDQG